MEQLCDTTLQAGFLPAVVPEFRTITVGGAIQGAALESSSFHHGQFNDTCASYEVVLGNGELVLASASQHSDLYYGLAGAYGTLGFLTGITLRLEPACRYVRLCYHPLPSAETLFDKIKNLCDRPDSPDYIEALVLGPATHLLICGYKIDSPDGLSIASQQRPWHPWFYQHASQVTRQGHQPHTEVMPIRDYLFRHDRGAFWMGQFLLHPTALLNSLMIGRARKHHRQGKPPVLSLPRQGRPYREPSLLARLLLGWRMSSRSLYELLHLAPEEIFARTFVVQDCYLPWDAAPFFLEESKRAFGIFPIWICPLKSTQQPQLFSPHRNETPRMVNIGVYGIPQTGLSAREATRHLEQMARHLGGRKMLYSQSYYSKDEFWQLYDHPAYQALRQRYHAEGVFMDIFDKVC